MSTSSAEYDVLSQAPLSNTRRIERFPSGWRGLLNDRNWNLGENLPHDVHARDSSNLGFRLEYDSVTADL